MLKGGSEHRHSLEDWLWTAREWWGLVGGRQEVEGISLKNVGAKENEGERTIERRSLTRRDHGGRQDWGHVLGVG